MTGPGMSVKERIDRYLAYNWGRVRKAVLFNEEKAALHLKIIPLLLHVNLPDLPGYLPTPGSPQGIMRFVPLQAVSQRTFSRFFPKSSAYDQLQTAGSPASCAIHSLMTIGSVGTIAQTAKSDCDYWLAMRYDELPPHRLDLLLQKCRAIEAWASEQGAEVHFFPMDLEQTKTNTFTSRAEDESAGSSLKLLLKDELFRTHILVAGKLPLWWLTPPGLSESGYQDFVTNLVTREQLNMDSFVDLGCIPNMPRAEIFGASLWQMNKALDSPFKSVLKFAYLELLMSDRQNLNLFSDRIKQLVTFPEDLPSEQRLNVGDIDPYLLLARELVTFYEGEVPYRQRDEFIRACLLMKTLEDLKPNQPELEDSVHIQEAALLMQRWGLLPANANHYLNFRNWSHQDRLAVGAMVHRYLGDTYKRLSGYRTTIVNQGEQLTITDQDISILGRKLSTFYAKKDNKIDFIQSLSSYMMAQSDITIGSDFQEGRDLYSAYQGDDEAAIRDTPQALLIKRDDHLIRLLTWLLANGILTGKTRLHLIRGSANVDLGSISSLTNVMLTSLPWVRFSQLPASQLLEAEVIVSALAVVNFDKAPVRGAKTIASSIISLNNYGEYFLHDYDTVAKYKTALRLLLTRHGVSRWSHSLTVYIPPQPEQHALQALLDG